MAFSKSINFSQTEQHLSLLCKALSHPARIHIIKKLMASKDQEMNVEKLIRDLPLHQSTCSQHLRILRQSHILLTKKEGNKIIYKFNDNMPISFVSIIKLIWNEISENSEILEQEIRKMTRA